MKTFDGTPVATIRNATTGRAFTMRLVRKGDGYGRDLSLIHDKDEPLVEFYDAHNRFQGERGAEYGQFVSRYYVKSIQGAGHSGLILDGGVEAWRIDSRGMYAALVLLDSWLWPNPMETTWTR